MTLVTVGVDPGISGAIGLLVDGEYGDVWDMPIEAKALKGSQVDCSALIDITNDIKQRYKDITIKIVVEKVTAGGPAMKGRTQGVSSAFSFGDSFGCARFFAALFPTAAIEFIHSSSWKSSMKLNKNKEFSITKAKRMFPGARPKLARKKDDGRAEALLLSRWLFDRVSQTKK